MEIERKFLVDTLPENLDSYDKKVIKQGYISTSPVIRIRQSNEKYILTVKSKGLLAREEFELFITEEEFNSLKEKVSGNIIEKTRYIIPINFEGLELKIELDIFEGDFEGLYLAEVEFPDEETAKKYNPPAFFGKEVTFDGTFHNSYMSCLKKDLIPLFITRSRVKE